MEIRPGKRSTYDQYTFYRLLSQMGVDSTPYIKGKLHLNYQNEIGLVSTNLVPWTNAVEFFTKAADLMIADAASNQQLASGRPVRVAMLPPSKNLNAILPCVMAGLCVVSTLKGEI